MTHQPSGIPPATPVVSPLPGQFPVQGPPIVPAQNFSTPVTSSPKPPELPPAQINTEPARIKFKGRTYNICIKINEINKNPSLGNIRAIQALIGTMLSHGLAALEAEHPSVKINDLKNLKIIESVPQDVEKTDAQGNTFTEKVIKITLEYKYKKGGKTQIISTDIKDVLKLQDKDNKVIDSTCPNLGYDDRRAIDTVQKAYLKAMEILDTDRALIPNIQGFKPPEPFNITSTTLNSTALDVYKPSEKEQKEIDAAKEKDDVDSAEDDKEKTADNTKIDPETSFKNPFTLRDAEKPYDPNSEKSSESKKSESKENWEDHIPLYQYDDEKSKKSDSSWSEYLLKGIVKDKEGKIIAKSDAPALTEEQAAKMLFNKLLIKKKPLHIFYDPLNHLTKEEKRLLKRFILLFKKAQYDKKASSKRSEQKSFEKFAKSIITRLDSNLGNNATNLQQQQAQNLKEHIDRFIEKNPDLREFDNYIKKRSKSRRQTSRLKPVN